MISIPARIVCARRKDLNPVISFILRLMLRWSCSIKVLTLSDLNAVTLLPAGIQLCKGCGVCTAFIYSHHFRFAVLADGFAEETQGSRSVPFRGLQEINGLPVRVYRPVKIFPLAFNPDVCFVHSPESGGAAFITTKNLIQKWHHADNPPVQGGMVNDDATLSHHLFQITQAQGIRQIPADTLRDDINWEQVTGV
jgi:hypothetical protein